MDLDNDLPSLKRHLTAGRAANPPGLTVTSYVATLLVAQAVRSSPAIATAEDLEEALLQQREVRTPDRIFQVKERIVQFRLAMKTFGPAAQTQ